MKEIFFKGPYKISDIADNTKPEFSLGGVYLWTLQHNSNIYVVYVGETSNFNERFIKYNRDFNNSDAYFVFPDTNDNLYSLLNGDDKEFYDELYKLKKFWYPKQFEETESWVLEYSKRYRGMLDVYLLFSDKTQLVGLNESERKSLQTQIQKALRKEHKINYYSKKDQCWLGQEDQAEFLKYNFKLIDIPGLLDSGSKVVLNNLSSYILNHFS